MEQKRPTRQEALELSTNIMNAHSCAKHAYAVEGVMRYIAGNEARMKRSGGSSGLIHDLDYESFPINTARRQAEITERERLARGV